MVVEVDSLLVPQGKEAGHHRSKGLVEKKDLLMTKAGELRAGRDTRTDQQLQVQVQLL